MPTQNPLFSLPRSDLTTWDTYQNRYFFGLCGVSDWVKRRLLCQVPSFFSLLKCWGITCINTYQMPQGSTLTWLFCRLLSILLCVLFKTSKRDITITLYYCYSAFSNFVFARDINNQRNTHLFLSPFCFSLLFMHITTEKSFKKTRLNAHHIDRKRESEGHNGGSLWELFFLAQQVYHLFFGLPTKNLCSIQFYYQSFDCLYSY